MTIISHLKIRNSDIICGRGKGFDTYVGNQIFRDVIKEHSATYIGYGANRTAKSNTIRKIFEDIAVYKNMRFVAHTKKHGWVLMEEREIKLKIGHALRDANTVRQKQARKSTEGKQTNKKKPSTARTKSPVEDARLQAILHSNHAENVEPLKSALTPKRPEVESSLQGKDHALGSRTESRTQSCSYCCNCQGNHIHEHRQGKQDETAGMTVDGFIFQNMSMTKNFIPLDYNRGNTPSVLQDVESITTEHPLTPISPPDVEPLPLSYDFSMDKEGMQALSSICSSLKVEGGDASSAGFDVAFSGVFPDCTEGADDIVDLASLVDWVF